MPARYTSDPPQKLVWIEYSGEVADEDLLENQDRLRADPRVGEDFAVVVDCRRVLGVSVTPDGLRKAARRRPFQADSPLAVIAPQAVVYGLARMFEVYHPHASPATFRIFDNAAEACDWLRITPPEPS